MKTVELQNSIIRKILNTKDNQLLVYLNSILAEGENPEIYKLNDFEKKILHESIADYKNGNVISNDDVFSKSEKWLEE
jgi:hypothetical protein